MDKKENDSQLMGGDNVIANLNIEDAEREKRKAAYALNLCTISVSQIIDYEDLNILEQEYEMILNNLNLEKFPKDEPLLHILKQILDTITFFRMYEGDKKILDKKYQHKMKNAIWSAIPNFTFVASGNPYAIAVSAISAIGMGYMNYRKEKANISLEHEEETWKLQRSAIEQFNGLRRELFDTAWRLADTYGFKDEDRLTEKQITAYNKILMDPIPLRKYERLNAIQQYFEAYPPFWFNLGKAAIDVAKIFNNPEYQFYDSPHRLEMVSKYRSLAEVNFHKFLEYDHSLLRTNYIRSSCCLEYAALLLERNAENSRDQILQLIADAEKYAPEALDVLQICAIYSLKINDIVTAQRLLRKLVIEEFNTITNAQILSYTYLNVAFTDKKLYDEKTKDYEELVNYADSSMLVPWADNVNMLNKKGIDRLRKQFLDYQKTRVGQLFCAVVDKIVEKCAIEYNQILFQPLKQYQQLDETLYFDSKDSANKRKNLMSSISNNKDEWHLFVYNLRNKNIALVLNDNLNELCRILLSLVSQTLETDIEKITATKSIASEFKYNFFSKFSKIIEKANAETIDINDYNFLIDATFTSITSKYVETFKKEACKKLIERENFNEIVSVENELEDFCVNHHFPSPQQLCEVDDKRVMNEKPRKFVDILGFFDGADNIKENADKESEIKARINEFINSNKLFSGEKNINKEIIFSTNEEELCERRKRLSKSRKILTYIDNRGSILAYFHDNKRWLDRFRDMYFLREGFVLVLNGAIAKEFYKYYEYNQIQYDSEKNEIYIEGFINDDIYSSETLNVKALYELMKQLGGISLRPGISKNQ